MIEDTVVPLVSPRLYAPKLGEVSVSSTLSVPPISEMVITEKQEAPLKGLVPTGYVEVFEPQYTSKSETWFCIVSYKG